MSYFIMCTHKHTHHAHILYTPIGTCTHTHTHAQSSFRDPLKMTMGFISPEALDRLANGVSLCLAFLALWYVGPQLHLQSHPVDSSVLNQLLTEKILEVECG